MSAVIKVENLSKQYRLGVLSARTLRDDVQQWWHKVRGLPDPLTRVDKEQTQTDSRVSAPGSDRIWALRDVSFEVEQGQVLGVIGRNGAGKSTLLKILSRVTAPTTGSVCVKGRIASLLEVGTGFHPELTGRENIFLNGAILGMNRREIANKMDEIIDFSEVATYIDTPVKRYSSGMYVRLAFAVAAHLDPEIMVVDEVLAVGDNRFQEKCLGKMSSVSKSGKTILFVSHNMHSIEKLCDNAIQIGAGQVVQYGSTKEVISNYLRPSCSEDHIEYEPNPDKPSITSVSLDSEALKTGQVIVHIGYESPFPIIQPVGGMAITESDGTALYGSNSRFHKEGYDPEPSKKGVLTCTVRDLPIINGSYALTAWLADIDKDYDEKSNALSFEFHSNHKEANRPDVKVTGHMIWPAKWDNEKTS